jgi:putative chitinase
MSTQSTNTTATSPTGDIKLFIDAFNKDFDTQLKSLLDSQQNYKNVYADAIKISTPKKGRWPLGGSTLVDGNTGAVDTSDLGSDPKVVTIGDLFKYTFPDINSDKIVKPDRYSKEYGGWAKDLKASEDEKIKTMYDTISNGISSNRKIEIYQSLKKPGITNPSLWSPGQYYFDVFMMVMLSPIGPLKDPSGANAGEGAFGGNIVEGGGWENGWLKANGGSASVSNFSADAIGATGSFGYLAFYEIIEGGYVGSGVKYRMIDLTDIDIHLDDAETTPPKSFPSLFTQYRTGPLSEFISVENGKINRKDPLFRIHEGIIKNPADKEIEISDVRSLVTLHGLTDLTGYKFVGYYEHMLLYKAFIQAGDNYKAVVLPVRNPEEPQPVQGPVTVLAKNVAPTAVGEVQFKFNVEKIDTFIVVGGTVSPPLEFIIVPNDGTQYIIDTPADVFNDDDLGDEYKEDIFAGDDEAKNTYELYIMKIEEESGVSLTPEEKKDIATDIVKYKPGKPSKSPPADVIKAMKDYGITNALEQAHFLAQCAHESGQFAWKREFASGKAYEGRKDLGNTQTGDGVRYKGRGYIQITGRANYTSYNNYLKSKSINDDVVAHPELLEGKFAADCSVWFWSVAGPKGNKNFPKRSKQGSSTADVTQISKWVNGGTNGLQDRIDKFGYYWSVLEKNGTAYS